MKNFKDFMGKIAIVFCIAIMFAFLRSSNAWAANIITTDKTVYSPGEKITITYTLDDIEIQNRSLIAAYKSNIIKVDGDYAYNDDTSNKYLLRNIKKNGTDFIYAPANNGSYNIRLDNRNINGVYIGPYVASAVFQVNSNLSTSILLNKVTDSLQVGQTDMLTATITPDKATNKNVTWSTSDSSIATVDTTGNVTAVKEGQAIITATTTDGSNLSASCTVNVKNPIISTSGITLNKTSDSINIGQTDNLTVTTTPAAVGVTWKSSDISVATVDSTGKVTAVKEGQATITATTTDGSNLSASCIVNVIKIPVDPNPNPTPNPEQSNIVNIAHAKGDNTNNAGGSVTIIFNGVADATLSVVKTADVKSVYVGDTFTYTIVVTNTGTKTAKAVVISDSAPNHIDFIVGGITTTQGKVDASSTSKNIMVNVGDIPPSGTVTITIPSTVIL